MVEVKKDKLEQEDSFAGNWDSLSPSDDELAELESLEVSDDENETAESLRSPEHFKRLGHGAIDAYVHSTEAPKKREFTPREGEHYFDSHYRQNVDYLRRHSTPRLLRTYKELINEYPELESIELQGLSIDDNAWFSDEGVDSRDGHVCGSVSFNFEHSEKYAENSGDVMSGDLMGIQTALFELALRTGANPNDVLNNKDLVSSFIFAHEMGHADDFYNSFYRLAVLDTTGSYFEKNTTPAERAKALTRAVDASNMARRSDMSQVLDASLKKDSKGNETLADILDFRLRALDVQGDVERDAATSKSYRTSRSENFADTFAQNFIRSHYDEFFYDPSSGEAARGRTPSYVNKGRIPLDASHVRLMDFTPGKGVIITRCDPSGNPISRSESVYMHSALRRGGEFSINTSGDSKDDSSIFTLSRSRPDAFMLSYSRNRYGEVAASCHVRAGNDYFKIEHDPKRSNPPEIDVDPREFIEEANLMVGDNISLLKVSTGRHGNHTAVKNGSLLRGNIIPPYNARRGTPLITVGDAIVLNRDNDGRGSGGNTSNVRRVFRRYNQYYVETATSTYELLPTRRKKKH